jgi:hypothetical protein
LSNFRALIGLTVALAGVCLFPAATIAQDTASAVTALTPQGAWSPTTQYHLNDIVTARGSTWRAKKNSLNRIPGQTAPSTAAFWELFAGGFNPTGAWSNATKYQPNDLVTYLGQTYRARITHKNRQPNHAAFWEVLAAKGAPGPNSGIAAGSSGAPAISFSGDGDTGIYSPAAGRIALVEDGALFLHNTGINNTALGLGALQANSAGGNNTAVGSQALAVSTNGDFNTAVGQSTLASNTVGDHNVAVGSTALENNTGGGFNVAVGSAALAANGNGSSNVAVGSYVLGSNISGGSNVGVGANALYANTGGNTNTAVGNNALTSNTTGTNNTVVGNNALDNNTTGTNNTAVGNCAGCNATAPSNSVFISNAGISGDTNLIRIGSPQTKAFIAGIRGVTTGANNAVAVLIDSSGQLGTVSSSRRYKDDIKPMPDMTAALMKLRPVTFRYKKPFADGSKPLQYGLIAEEVAQALPYLAVFNDKGQPETVKYHELPAFLLEAYQRDHKVIAAQAEEIAALRQRVDMLAAQLARRGHARVQHASLRGQSGGSR